ncbi:MAG: transketolase [Gemmatimonadales bacterium]
MQPTERARPASAATASRAELDRLCVNTVRALTMDAVERAKSGHPGAPMGLAPLGYVLWSRHLKHNPRNPDWFNRDRFVLSCGHACMLIYSMLYLTGYELSLDELKNFRQWGSRTPGHPEHGLTPGVETTTGPLGQGFANAVGMALAEARLASEMNRPGYDVVDHHTYFIVSDGDLMEGISHEVASFAGHLKLGKLIGFYDNNRITIDGPTSLAYSDDAARRFEAYGWYVDRVEDGNDLEALDRAIESASSEGERPSLIIVDTHIAYGSPNKQDTAESHGAPLGAEEVALAKQNLGWDYTDDFYVPDEALKEWRRCLQRGAEVEAAHSELYAEFKQEYPAVAAELERRIGCKLPPGWEEKLPSFSGHEGAVATRAASGKVINALAPVMPELVGGSADLSGSTSTLVQDSKHVSSDDYTARNIHFGVREHGMGGMLSGMARHGGFIPYGGTFLIFSDYMRPSIRLAAMMGLKVIYVFTHDSIGLGEDGPTHQPVEQLSALRAIPNMTVIRPSDAGETVEAWRAALSAVKGPVALVLTRQKVPLIDRRSVANASGLLRGGYVLADSGGEPAVVLIASGSEVELALGARDELFEGGVVARVVSMPSLELFTAQDEGYRSSVLPQGIPRVAIEAAHPMSWYRVVGEQGIVIGLERFGASSPYKTIYEELGFTVKAVAEAARSLVNG